MLRRALWFRTVASLLALWLPLVAGGSGILPPCPLHGAVPSAAAGGHSGAAAGSMHAHHHAMAAHEAQGAPGQHQSAPAHEHHQCSCMACCGMTVAATGTDAAPVLEVPVAIRGAAVGIPLRTSGILTAAEYSRPFTTGPPRA